MNKRSIFTIFFLFSAYLFASSKWDNLTHLHRLWRRTKIGGYYIAKRVNRAFHRYDDGACKTILGYDPQICVVFPTKTQQIPSRIDVVNAKDFLNSIPLFVSHGFMNSGFSYAHYKNAELFKRPIISFDYPEVENFQNINLGEEGDTSALLYALIQTTKKLEGKQLDIFAHSRGAGTVIRVLHALLYPKNYKGLFMKLGIDVDTEHGCAVVEMIKAMLSGRAIMLAYPMLSAQTAIKHMADQMTGVVKLIVFSHLAEEKAETLNSLKDLVIKKLQSLTKFTNADVQPIDLLEDVIKSRQFSVGFAFAKNDHIVSNEYDHLVKKLIEVYPVDQQQGGAYLITDQGNDHDDLDTVYKLIK